MAKQSLPSVESVQHSVVLEKGAIVPESPATVEQNYTQFSEGYVSRRVDIKLSREAALKLRDKTRQLQDSGAKTADGRFVTNKTQAIQWIFENEVIA